MHKVKISPQANKDIYAALDYYDKINSKLSIELFNIIFENIELIKQNPLYFSVKYKNIRTFPIEKFPYIIAYFIDDSNNTVNVIAVFNTAQDPLKLKKRN